METLKEAAVTIGASAKSGLDKTKAIIDEKVERMKAHDPLEKELAEQKKQDRIQQAELEKRQVINQSRSHPTNTYTHSVTGEVGKPTGGKQMSALPGHGTGEPAGNVVEGVVPSHPIGVGTGIGRPSASHNTRMGAGTNKGSGTGGAYS